MRLFVDTNILVRCSRGNLAPRLAEALRRGVILSVTSRNIEEFIGVLCSVFGLDESGAVMEVARILEPFEVVEAHDLADYRSVAEARLHRGGEPDWPSLAGAIAMDAGIWSEGRDYFGVGVPVWSTANIGFAAGMATAA